MTYREFTDHTKAAVTELVRGLRGSRDPSPMVHMAVGGGVDIIGVDAAFFDPDEPSRRLELVEKFIVPLIHERDVRVVGVSFAGTRSLLSGEGARVDDVMVVVTMDREVQEAWIAERAELEVGTLDAWAVLPPNEQVGRLITPIQEALR